MNMHKLQRKQHILLLGCIFKDDACLRSKALSPAAKKWQAGFVRGLKYNGFSVSSIGHKLEPLWPRGKLFPGCFSELEPEFDSTLVRYINFPVLRPLSLAVSYLYCISRQIKASGRPLAVLSYNYTLHIRIILFFLKDKLQFVPIILDRQDPKPCLSDLKHELRGASKVIYVSYWASVNSPKRPSFHLDGGISAQDIVDLEGFDADTIPHSILYSGMMTKWGGVLDLIKGFKKLENQLFKLWICGHGPSKEVEDAVRADSRITYLGFVDEERLTELSRKASIFINPRPSHQNGNRMNFPSKTYQYLRFLKPVISTMTPGLSPDISQVLFRVDKETPTGLAKAITIVDSWSLEQRYANARLTDHWLRTNGSWNLKCKKLAEWLNQ